MKKISVLILSACLLLAASCTKKKDSGVKPDPGPTASPYYFKFTFEGTNYNLSANIPQYMIFYENEAGGYQVANANLYPAVGLRLTWSATDTVRESDLMALKGKTLYFNDTAVHPSLTYDVSLAAAHDWESVDTSNTAYNVKITDVTFLKKDTSINPLKTYVITGTCNALMSKGDTMNVFSSGEFHFIISRRDL